jgi:GNAT superfamily N-acetyltransferase
MAVINIYHEAFPMAQRVEDSALLRLVPRGLHEPGGWVFHLAERRTETVGFATGLHVSPLGLAYIAYLAVAPTWRGQGVGTALFRSLTETWKVARPRPPHWLFLEVERPELARNQAELDQRLRRIRFYERLGCRFIRADFQAPPLGPDLPVVPYWIFMLPMQDPDLGPKAIRTALADIYREVYSLDEDHPLVRNCLDTLGSAPKG